MRFERLRRSVGPAATPRISPSTTCRAARVSLRFSPTGQVDPCCANDRYVLGRVGTEPLLDIWASGRRQVLAEALDRADFSLGCQDCGVENALGNRLESPAKEFDDYPDGDAVWPRRLEFALSNRCNLECLHCNGDLSSTIRARREHLPPLPKAYDDEFFEQIVPFLEHAEVVTFIGGEPFLAPEARRMWNLLLELDTPPAVHVTTNGTVWNSRVEQYVYGLRMNAAISIDGATAETFEKIRVGASFDRTIAVRNELMKATRSYGGAFTINHCWLVPNWH